MKAIENNKGKLLVGALAAVLTIAMAALLVMPAMADNGSLTVVVKDENGNKPPGCVVMEVWDGDDCSGTRVGYKSWAPAEYTFTGLSGDYWVRTITGPYSRCDGPVTVESSAEIAVPCSELKINAFANDNTAWPVSAWRGMIAQVLYNGQQVAYQSWWNPSRTFTLLDTEPHESYEVKITQDGVSKVDKGVVVFGDDEPNNPIVHDVSVGRLKVKLLAADYQSNPAGPLGAPITINCDGKFVTHAGHGWHTEADFNLLAGQTYTIYVKWNDGKETWHDVTVLETTSGMSPAPDGVSVILIEP